ncbi:hypothetical protein F4782DRAFT_502843 [Xylaria castorea]|nr:hypothetical protein F4782DRAFT_502843 [Xylaria castorea]
MSETNVNNPIAIRSPETRTLYTLDVMGRATKGHKPNKPAITKKPITTKKPATTNKSVITSMPAIASKNQEIIIAHGSYIPGAVNDSYKPSSPQSNYSYSTPGGNHWAPGTPSTASTISSSCYTQPGGSPSLPTSHTVSLSGFHHHTTLSQVQTMVGRVSSSHELNDRNIQFVDGSTIVTSDKADARRLKRAFNGLRIRGVPITARRGQQPYDAPQSWGQNWGQNWGQGWEQGWGQYSPQYWPQSWGYKHIYNTG